MVKLLHPDVCHLPSATEAVTRLNQYRNEMDKYSRVGGDLVYTRNSNVQSAQACQVPALLQQSFKKLYFNKSPFAELQVIAAAQH